MLSHLWHAELVPRGLGTGKGMAAALACTCDNIVIDWLG